MATTEIDQAPPRRWIRLGIVLAFIACIVGFYILGGRDYLSWKTLHSRLTEFRSIVDSNLSFTLVLFLLVYVVVTALSLPIASTLSLIAGAIFGRWLGTGVVITAATCGATLAFLSSRLLFRDWVERQFGARLKRLQDGVEAEGAFYLFTLRLIPFFPFFLVNLGMGLTPIRVWTFFWVSMIGMLPGTFLYVNAGRVATTLDEAGEIMTPGVLISFASLGLAPLLFRRLLQLPISGRAWRWVSVVTVISLVAAVGLRSWFRYRVADEMNITVREYSNHEYPDDPAHRSVHFGKYDGRTLRLLRKDATHFDFIFESPHKHLATVAFRNIDVSLMTPGLPEWTKQDPGLTRIALTDRQWNRQQVRFDLKGPNVAIEGGDGFEKRHLFSAELAKNCLNAGLWEILLFVEEDGKKTLYYHGWFTFPLGHYRAIFEHNTGLEYWRHWYYLEHWFDPAGIELKMVDLRTIVREAEAETEALDDESIFAAGEQLGKRRVMRAENVVTWRDFQEKGPIRFATFHPPGRYNVTKPWKNEFWRFRQFEKAILRETKSPLGESTHELELRFRAAITGETCRFLIGGVDLRTLPSLKSSEYPKGLYMPMGIGVPPFFQSVVDLGKNPPAKSAFYCLMLDEDNRWINHHQVAIDGPVVHRDVDSPNTLHVYMLSYERHTLVNHFVISMKN